MSSEETDQLRTQLQQSREHQVELATACENLVNYIEASSDAHQALDTLPAPLLNLLASLFASLQSPTSTDKAYYANLEKENEKLYQILSTSFWQATQERERAYVSLLEKYKQVVAGLEEECRTYHQAAIESSAQAKALQTQIDTLQQANVAHTSTSRKRSRSPATSSNVKREEHRHRTEEGARHSRGDAHGNKERKRHRSDSRDRDRDREDDRYSDRKASRDEPDRHSSHSHSRTKSHSQSHSSRRPSQSTTIKEESEEEKRDSKRPASSSGSRREASHRESSRTTSRDTKKEESPKANGRVSPPPASTRQGQPGVSIKGEASSNANGSDTIAKAQTGPTPARSKAPRSLFTAALDQSGKKR